MATIEHAPLHQPRAWMNRAGALVRSGAILLLGLLILAALWLGSGLLVPVALVPLVPRVRGFVTIFFGIFVEALPFLMAGVLVSSAIHLFITPERLQRIVPRNPLAAALVGSCLGLVFPVCECGSIPAARRLISRGAPLPLGIAFVLASPVINPIVIISTAVAFVGVFGWQFVAWRVGLTLVVAIAVALILGITKTPAQVLAAHVLCDTPNDDHQHQHNHDHHDHGHVTPSSTGGWATQLLRTRARSSSR